MTVTYTLNQNQLAPPLLLAIPFQLSVISALTLCIFFFSLNSFIMVSISTLNVSMLSETLYIYLNFVTLFNIKFFLCLQFFHL